MKTKEEIFAVAMAVLLFEMRVEDIDVSNLFDSQSELIPETFVNSITDDELQADTIRERIRDAILNDAKEKPSYFKLKHVNATNGEYMYSTEVYDYAYLVDEYIQEKYEDTQTKCVYICTHCNSDNVQVKSWTRPNEGQKFVDEVEGDTMGWCGDEGQVADIQTAEVKRSSKVIGFQVVGEAGTPSNGKLHPHMDNNKSIYSLDQANSMLDDDNQGDEKNWWRLLTIWSDDIPNPVMMFEGDLR